MRHVRVKRAPPSRIPLSLEDDFYLQILESLQEYAVFTISLDGIITSWNRGSQHIFQYRNEEIIGKPAGVIFTAEDVARGAPQAEMKDALRLGKAIDERWHVRKDGSAFWGSGRMFPLRGPRHKAGGFTKIVQDLTERRIAEDRSSAARRMLQTVTDNVPALIAYVDSRERYSFVNANYEEWFRRPREEFLGRTIRQMLGEPAYAVLRPAIERALRGEAASFDAEIPFIIGKRWVHVNYLPDPDPTGRVKGFVVLVIDISEMKKVQEELHQAREGLEREVARRTQRLREVNRELESFTYSASHDLRAPLRKIDAFSRMVLEHCGRRLDEDCRRNFDRVRAATRQMHRLIDDMLNLARITQEPLRQADVDLSALADSIVAELRKGQPGRRADIRIAPGLKQRGDPGLWRVALWHLLENAWKFSQGASVTRIELGVSEKHGRKTYFVKDNGVGFDMSRSARIFEAFERLHRPEDFPGTGMGLAIASRAIERQGGKIWAESSPGRGAVFHFSFREPSG